jgi:DNA binding domain, excisionase family
MSKVEALEKEIEQLKAVVSMPADEVMTLKEAADYLKISDAKTWRLAKAGIIPFTRKTGDYRIMKSKLIAWLNSDGRKRN